MSRQPEEFISSKQSKMCSNPSNGGECTRSDLRAPFSTHLLTEFMNSSKHKSNNIVDPPRLFPLKPIQRREYEVNPTMKTMYQYQYSDPADVRLGHCDNRSIESRNEHFKRCQKHGRDFVELFKLRLPEPPPRKYKSDRSKRVSEYTAEISYVGAKILSSRIHDHSQCGRLPKNCVHYIEF